MFPILSKRKSQRVMLHMGCSECGNEEAYLGVKVLNKVGIKPDVFDFSCGCEYFGRDEKRIDDIAEESRPMLEKYSLAIVGCPRCYHVMLEHYPYIDVAHISQVLYDKIRVMDNHGFRGRGSVYYHDPSFLARYEKIMDEPRETLSMLGYTVKEFPHTREHTDSSGGYSPIIALRERAAQLRLSQIPKGSTVTSASPMSTKNFKDFNNPNNKITIKDFLELVDHGLNINILTIN